MWSGWSWFSDFLFFQSFFCGLDGLDSLIFYSSSLFSVVWMVLILWFSTLPVFFLWSGWSWFSDFLFFQSFFCGLDGLDSLIFYSSSIFPCTKCTIIIFILLLASFAHQHLQISFHWSLNDSKSSLVFRMLLSFLVDLKNAVIWMVANLPNPPFQSFSFNHINYNCYYCYPNVPQVSSSLARSKY